MNVSLTLEEYEALLSMARKGASVDGRRQLEPFLQSIEKRNGITRYFLWVQWQEAGYALPPTAKFPEIWPPELRMSIERTDRAISLADVTKAMETRAKKPTNILVTTDPGATLGWTELHEYFHG
jgi:hypothetical protein